MATKRTDRPTVLQLRQDLETLRQELDRIAIWTSADGRRSVRMADWTFQRNKKRRKGEELIAAEREAVDSQHSLYKALQGRLGPLQRQLNQAEEVEEEGAVHVLDTHKPQILEWFGRYTSAAEVHRRLVTELGLAEISYQVLLRFADRNSELIREKQRTMRADTSDLPLTHKRGRLETLHRLATDAEQRYNLTGSREEYRHLLSTLEQIRKEVEGDRFHVDVEGQIQVDVQATIRVQVAQQMMQDLNVQYVVIARLAAARGLDPLRVMAALQTSYYAKLNGFQNPKARMGDSADFLYPSQQPYEWQAINAQHTGGGSAGPGEADTLSEAQFPPAPAGTGPASPAPAVRPTLKELLAARTQPPLADEEA